MSKPNDSIMPRNVSNLLLVLVCLIGGYAVWRMNLPPVPQLLAQSRGPVTAAKWSDGAWYWLDGAGTPSASLVRAAGPGRVSTVAEGGILSYAVGEGRLAWITRSGGAWKINSGSADGARPVEIWQGEQEPHGLCIAGNRIWWVEQAPPVGPDCGALPPLDAAMHVLSAPTEGGPAATVGEIMEPGEGRVIGVEFGQVYVSASRGRLESATVIYRLPSNGGSARRLTSELGDQRALLTRNGVLYWTGQSREAADPTNVATVYRLGPGDRLEPLADWLPYGGSLYDAPGGVCYVDRSFAALAWPVVGSAGFAVSMPQPSGYATLAVGNGETLMEKLSDGKGTSLYRIPVR